MGAANGMGEEDKIPIIDMKNLYQIHVGPQDPEMIQIADHLRDAFHKYGFAYMANHGIPPDTIESAFAESRTFFQLPAEIKAKCAKKSENVLTNFHGYSVPGQENLDDSSIYEIRENFDCIQQDRFYPTEDAPGFQPAFEKLERACRSFDLKVYRILAMALKLDDPDYFVKISTHLTDDSLHRFTDLRSNYYPPLPPNDEGSHVGAVRCGEHTDWDMFALLFQDDMGGLEVKTASGEWIKAPPIPGTIVVNIGDLLEVCTGGYFPSTKHRVLVPEEEVKKRSSRQSIGFFVFPDDHVLIEPLKSPVLPTPSVEYKPTTSYENFRKRAGSAYGVAVN